MTSSTTVPQVLLNPVFQDAFWGSLDPDLRSVLSEYESRETWTYKYDEIPNVFNDLSTALMMFNKIEVSDDNSDLLFSMIKILSNIPMRSALSSVAWMDRDLQSDSKYGWAAAIYLESARVMNTEPTHPLYKECKATYERLRLALHSRLSALLFSNFKPIGDK